jgi:hypothetical protein
MAKKCSVKKEKKLRFPKAKRNLGINADGSEICDSKPTELRASMQAPVTMRQKMRQLWAEFREKEMESEQMESIQDAADFDVSNDDFLSSEYEVEGSLKHVLDYVDEEVKSAVAQQAAQDAVGIEAEGGIEEGGSDE